MSMKMMKCRACGAEIAKSAKRCPHCGAKQHIVALTLCWIIVVLTIIGIFSSIIGNSGNDGSANKQQVEGLTDGQKAENRLKDATSDFADGDYISAIKICDEIVTNYSKTTIASNMKDYLKKQYALFPSFSAKGLMSKYDANLVNADKEYTDKVLIITGTISNIGKTNNGSNLCVMLNSGTYYYGVQLNFDTDQTDEVATLSNGQEIKAIGKCTGKSGKQLLIVDSENVMIEDCIIIK